MKRFILPIFLAATVLSSCNSNKYATTGKGTYETDEVYYQPSDTYISDFALVDDEAQMAEGDQATSSVPSNTEEDYVDGDNATNQSGNVTNNYYGNVYQSPWGCGYGSGYGSYGYGSYSCWPGTRYNLGWDPWNGWYFAFNFGYNWGCYPYYNPYYSYGYGWYSGYYNPWYYNQWGYNTWYSPYNYYNPYYGYNNPYYGGYWGGNYWNDENDYASVLFGHRNPLATGTIENSTYGEDLFYTGREVKPAIGDQPVMATSSAMAKPAVLQTTSRPSLDANPAHIGLNENTMGQSSHKPVVIDQNTENTDVMTQKPSRDVSPSTSFSTPQSSTANTTSERPRPTYVNSTRPEYNASQNTEQHSVPNNNSRPTYQAPSQQNAGDNYSRENIPSTQNVPSTQSSPSMKMPPMNTPTRENTRQPERVQTPSRDLSPSRETRPSTPTHTPEIQHKAPSNGGNPSRSGGGQVGGGNSGGGSRSGGGNGGGGSVSGPRRK